MALQNFVDGQSPTIKAAWLNAVDAFYVTLFQSAITAAAARTALGSTATGDAVFVAASASAARTALGVAIGTDVQGYDSNTIKANATKALSAGYSATPYNAGTKSSGTFTPDESNGNFQYCVNGGAHTLAPPTNNCTLIIQITNNASAGAITTSGFTKVTGTAPTTTNGDDFFAFVTKCNGFSHLAWQELQ